MAAIPPRPQNLPAPICRDCKKTVLKLDNRGRCPACVDARTDLVIARLRARGWMVNQ